MTGNNVSACNRSVAIAIRCLETVHYFAGADEAVETRFRPRR